MTSGRAQDRFRWFAAVTANAGNVQYSGISLYFPTIFPHVVRCRHLLTSFGVRWIAGFVLHAANGPFDEDAYR